MERVQFCTCLRHTGRKTASVRVDLYLQKNRTVGEIAEEVGASRSTIYSWLAMAGLSGNRTRLGVPVESAEPRAQIGEVLANQAPGSWMTLTR